MEARGGGGGGSSVAGDEIASGSGRVSLRLLREARNGTSLVSAGVTRARKLKGEGGRIRKADGSSRTITHALGTGLSSRSFLIFRRRIFFIARNSRIRFCASAILISTLGAAARRFARVSHSLGDNVSSACVTSAMGFPTVSTNFPRTRSNERLSRISGVAMIVAKHSAGTPICSENASIASTVRLTSMAEYCRSLHRIEPFFSSKFAR